MASASRFYRRRRVSWPIIPRASRMSAAKFSVRCSEERAMSKIGKRPVAVPTGVTAAVEGQRVKVKGPKGELSIVLADEVGAKLDKGAISVEKHGETKRHAAVWGMSRAMIANLVVGVTKGYEKKLEITGVGYRAAVAGKNLQLALGYSHDVLYPIPEGITIVTPKPTE